MHKNLLRFFVIVKEQNPKKDSIQALDAASMSDFQIYLKYKTVQRIE